MTREGLEQYHWRGELGWRGMDDLGQTIRRGVLDRVDWLNLSGNNLFQLPPEIGQLTNLRSLDLSGNKLLTLPPEIGQLTNLTWLDLSGNGFGTLCPEIGQLTNLTRLDLARTALQTLPPEISQLTNLTWLDLGGNGLRVLPLEIIELTNLVELNLSSNALSALPSEITELSNLTRLALSGNLLSLLPTEIFELTNLMRLDLNGNLLIALPPEIGRLTNLTELGLRHNCLTTLPREIIELTKLTILELSGNPFETPPLEVVEKGITAIKDYIRQLEAEGVDYLYEAKLLIVGEAGAGKTTLAKKIENQDYQLWKNEVSTKGIDVIRWQFPREDGRPFYVNIWDFGGQEIYHATHQFFLTKRSLYALVADTRKEDTDFFYWLNVVDLLSDHSPLLIVKNEKQDRHREIDESKLRGQFRNLKEILATNLATNRGLDGILDETKHHIQRLSHIGSKLPKTWVAVRKALEEDSRNYISLEEYRRICEQNGFADPDFQLQLSGYLHDLGVCLHFQDDLLLKRTVILNPEWGTDAVYKVLDNERVIRNLGQFTQDDLREIWREEKYANMQAELLQLMMNFKLCYEIPSRRGYYIAPQLLTMKQPEYKWDETDNLLLRYTYEFMPKGILTRFIVAMHRWIVDQKCVWRSGVVLEKDETRVEVIEHIDKREVKIRVVGKQKRDVLTSVIDRLDEIHASFHRLKYNKMIPCNCAMCRLRQGQNQDPHFYRFESLKRRISAGKHQVECDVSYEMVDVKRLIDGVTDRKMDNRRRAVDERERTGGNFVFKAPVEMQVIMEETVTPEKVIKIGKNATISAPVVIADSIENSFNMLTEARLEDELKSLLEELLKAVTQINQDAPPEHAKSAEEMARDAEMLVKEATSSRPRRRSLEFSIEGLKKAAKDIGEIAKPVLEIAGKLAMLLLPGLS